MTLSEEQGHRAEKRLYRPLVGLSINGKFNGDCLNSFRNKCNCKHLLRVSFYFQNRKDPSKDEERKDSRDPREQGVAGWFKTRRPEVRTPSGAQTSFVPTPVCIPTHKKYHVRTLKILLLVGASKTKVSTQRKRTWSI